MAKPSRSDRSRPAELIALAAVVAVFVGVVVFLSTRAWEVSLVFTGAGFIVALVLLAMLALAAGPVGQEKDLRGNDPTAPVSPAATPDAGTASRPAAPERTDPPSSHH